MTRFYSLYLGSKTVKPSSPNLKIKLLNILSKSSVAASIFPFFIQVLFDALFSATTTIKLQQAGMGFCRWVSSNTDPKSLLNVAAVLVSGILKFIKTCTDEHMSGFGYEAIGSIIKRIPDYFKNDLELFKTLVEALNKEPKNVKVSVQEALGMLANALNPSEELLDLLFGLVLNSTDSVSKLVAAKFTHVFPFSDAGSRVICIIASPYTKEESAKGLTFPPYSDDYISKIPNLDSLVSIISLHYLAKGRDESLGLAIEFIRCVILVSADSKPALEMIQQADEYKTEMFFNSKFRNSYRDYLKSNHLALDGYIQLIQHALLVEKTLLEASTCFAELLSFAPTSLSKQYVSKLDTLIPFITNFKPEIRVTMCRVLATIATSNLNETTETFTKLANVFINHVKDPRHVFFY